MNRPSYIILLAALIAVVGFANWYSTEEAAPRKDMSGQSTPDLEPIFIDMNTRVLPPANSLSKTATATFDVTYNGFSSNAQAAFQHAVDIWSGLLTSNVTIKVRANWVSLDPNVLGAAGANGFWRDFGSGSQSGTWYPVALAEKLSGQSLNPADSADIVATFNSDFSNWYFGTDGNTPQGQFDFVSVVLHELGHGLGFAGSMERSNSQGSWGFNSGFPFIYDSYAENGQGESLIDTEIFPNPSTLLGNQLVSGNVFFDGTQTRASNGGPARLYLPATWADGSSYSHLDEATYPAGNANSLMTPQIGFSEAIHDPGPVALAILQDMGWDVVTSIDDEDVSAAIDGFTLSQNYPNPFNPSTTIAYQLAQASTVSLKVYSITGQEVVTLVSSNQAAGEYTVQWNGTDVHGQTVSSGIYIYRIQAGKFVESKTMFFMK